jgi:hypothetical protein
VVSLRNVAVAVSTVAGETVSKQAVQERLNDGFCCFCQQMLSAVIATVIKREARALRGVFERFGRVLLHDSTVVSLDSRLAAFFPGANNQTGKPSASVRVQCVYDLKHDRYEHMELTRYRRNDQTAAGDLLSSLRAGDLLIRDLGYFKLAVFRTIGELGAYFLSRLQSGVRLYRSDDARPINLLRLLRKQGTIDTTVRAGAQEQLNVRLVALPVPEPVAAERRRKAQNQSDTRAKPSREKIELLGWEVFITNIPAALWPTQMITTVYGFRWRIEILFKAWKSCLSIPKLHPEASRYQVETLIHARLINVVMFHSSVWAVVRYRLGPHAGRLSLISVAELFNSPIGTVLHGLLGGDDHDAELLAGILLKHCCYEKRRRVGLGELSHVFGQPGATPANLLALQ